MLFSDIMLEIIIYNNNWKLTKVDMNKNLNIASINRKLILFLIISIMHKIKVWTSSNNQIKFKLLHNMINIDIIIKKKNKKKFLSFK